MWDISELNWLSASLASQQWRCLSCYHKAFCPSSPILSPFPLVEVTLLWVLLEGHQSFLNTYGLVWLQITALVSSSTSIAWPWICHESEPWLLTIRSVGFTFRILFLSSYRSLCLFVHFYFQLLFCGHTTSIWYFSHSTELIALFTQGQLQYSPA